MVKYKLLKERQLALTIVATLMNRFDFYAIIDGERGLGKSTVAYRLARLVSMYFKKMYRGDINVIMMVYRMIKKKRKSYMLEEMMDQLIQLKAQKAYIFEPQKNLVYDQIEAQRAIDRWRTIVIMDEFINIGYTRDFYDKEQKKLIKLINLNRDHNNLILACIPHFLTADVQLRNLCKMRIYIAQRGKAVIMTPNRGTAVRDKWDTDINAKIEAEWRKKKVVSPDWTRITTFTAVMTTRPLPPLDEELYQKIKNEKRTNLIIQSENETDPKKRVYQRVVEDLMNFRYKSGDELVGAAAAAGVSLDSLKRNVKKMLEEKGQSGNIKDYFFDPKKIQQSIRLKKIKKLVETIPDEVILAKRKVEGEKKGK